jgi:hypothetical protein
MPHLRSDRAALKQPLLAGKSGLATPAAILPIPWRLCLALV